MGGYDIPLPDPASGSNSKAHHHCLPHESSSSATSAKPAFEHELEQSHVHEGEASDHPGFNQQESEVAYQPNWFTRRSSSTGAICGSHSSIRARRAESPSLHPRSSVSSDRPRHKHVPQFLSVAGGLAKLILYGSINVLLWPVSKVLGFPSRKRGCRTPVTATPRGYRDEGRWKCHNDRCKEVNKVSNESTCRECGHYRGEPKKCKRCPKGRNSDAGSSSP